jgi:membrane associated rhomboid family serine protease
VEEIVRLTIFMSRLWHRVVSSFTPGVRVVLGLLLATSLATIMGDLSKVYNLNQWLALSGHDFWNGRVWPIVTYVLLPVSPLNLLVNCLVIAFLGGALERIWSRREIWGYCLIVTLGSGLTKILSQFSVPSLLAGPAPLVFGLLAAWGFLFRHEKVSLAAGSEITVGLIALLGGIINFVSIWFSTGLSDALIMTGGGLIGLLYLWLQAKMIMARGSRLVASERIQRLEL